MKATGYKIDASNGFDPVFFWVDENDEICVREGFESARMGFDQARDLAKAIRLLLGDDE